MSTVISWKRGVRVALFGLLAIAGVFLVIQLVYPPNSTVPLATVDGVNVGASSVDDAASTLSAFYQDAHLSVVQGATGDTIGGIPLADTGITLANASEQAHSQLYPWPLRLVPSSILWAHSVLPAPVPQFDRDANKLTSLVENKFTAWCAVPAHNAVITVNGTDLAIAPSATGISCDRTSLGYAVSTLTPTAASLTFTIPSSVTQPQLNTAAATDLRDRILSIFEKDALPISATQGNITIPQDVVLSWFSFPATFEKVPFTVDSTRIGEYFDQLAASSSEGDKAAFAKVDETDFADQLTTYVLAEKANRETLQLADLKVAKVIDAFLASHSGTFNVSLIELTNNNHRINANGDDSIITASTYKLFVAYSTIRAIDAGEFGWDGMATEDTTVSDCFDLMITVSDNTCAEALLDIMGMYRVQMDAQAQGATSTTFEPYNIHSTANDEAYFLAKLARNDLPISAYGRSRWLDAMKGNVYRDGIPSGIPGAVVADKVGFQDELLHDAAIVYSPKGDYILVIMTADASWEAIADLAAAIEAAR